MELKTLIECQLLQIKQGGREVLFIKMKRVLKQFPSLPLFITAIPAVLVIRLIRPWLLVRCGSLRSSSIGHFVGSSINVAWL